MSRPCARALLVVSTIALVSWVSGCARRPAVPPTEVPPRTAARPGYEGVSGYRPDLDFSPLRGRKVVLDPGHGGRWPGALGTEGTREADVNLRVALVLADLLRRAGSTVWLTRQSDSALVAPPETTLAADLRARAALADSVGADVFLSIHHNADAEARHDVNETQTYYRTGDEGPSLDLAQEIHRHLVTGLAIGADRLLPGNYAVLRQTHATSAVLGEPAYLTFPPTEKKLSQEQAVRLEAESYCMGLLDYFRSGVPRVLALGWEEQWRGSPAFRPLVARVEGVPDGVALRVDDQLISPARLTRQYDAAAGNWVLRAAPEAPWRDGGHALRLQVRNPAGNHSRPFTDTLEVDLPVARLVLEANPESLVAGPVSLTARALDSWNRPIADTLLASDVSWTVEPPRARAQARTRRSGARATRARPGPAAGAPLAEFRGAGPGESRAYLMATRPAAGLRLRARWGELTAAIELPPAHPVRAWRSGFVLRASDDRGVAGAQVSGADGAAAVTNPDGFFALRASPDSPLRAAAPGYHEIDQAAGDTLRLAAVAGGALLGRRIALDPEGGGDESGGSGPSGVRGALVNLAVARLTREALERAGALVVLTRESDSPVPALARVQAAERFRAERYVRIGRRPGGPTAVAYYPGSAGGRALAMRIHPRVWSAERADTLAAAAVGDSASSKARNQRRPPILLEDASYVLQQTSCPAVSIRFGDLARPEDEARFLDPAWRHREAALIYLALAADLGAPGDSLVSISLRLTEGGAPRSQVPVWLDGLLSLTDERGEVGFGALDPRVHHRLEVAWGGAKGFAEAWLDPARSTRWEWAASDFSPAPAAGRR